ncbi:DEAD/DEAH box helicase [Methylophilus sp. OH31]|uniref:DEAD/DEAH box helicase n=1 Tax=Methylophilus sp. OH31 TaxID=1387312 RepID=UPI00046483CC|nr:DEAD/DEAH box helicase [Methylophilus sp. OH31]
MKYILPNNHGLSQQTVDLLVFKENESPALSNVQHSALGAGVGRGESLLVVSPTSTGKTQIALWAIAKSLEEGCNTVYLVTHRALAKQKFDDFRTLLLPSYLSNDPSSLVLATGDYVVDSDGELPKEPLRSPLIVATYEKYLAMLSASGVPNDMRRTVIVCDEIQLLGDEHRGQSVEILLTLLRNAGWKQFVGLSAVLQNNDAVNLADWLGIKLVIETSREKHLRYECWHQNGVVAVSSQSPEVFEELENSLDKKTDVISALKMLIKDKNPPLPIIVFCMRKQDTYDLATAFIKNTLPNTEPQLSLVFEALPETSANTFLAKTIEARVASHNADLTDEERGIVEQHLLENKLDIVFATTTLAAGVNFPLGAAIFADWKRWDADLRARIPIEGGDFHNMAGRVGRMGFAHEHGRVIFFAASDNELRASNTYLQLGDMSPLVPRVNHKKFNQLALQLVSSGLCSTRDQLEDLVCNTFSALREQDNNLTSFAKWPNKLELAVNGLIYEGFLIESQAGKLVATPVGKSVGHSGLLPETCTFLLNYLARKSDVLASCLPSNESQGDIAKLSFLLFSACLCSPEFRVQGNTKPTRFLPFPLEEPTLFNPSQYAQDLAEPIWQSDVMPINAAMICREWMDGAEVRKLESYCKSLSAGMLFEMFRNLGWILQGLSSIITAASDKRVDFSLRPRVLQDSTFNFDSLAKLPRVIKRLSFRVAEGLPDDVLWMMALNVPGSQFKLSRSDVLSLKSANFNTPEKVMLGNAAADAIRNETFKNAKPSPQAKSNWLRDACRGWKTVHRQKASERHKRRASKCSRPELVDRYYSAKGVEFERVFEEILSFLGIKFERLDDKTKTGAPDYLLLLQDSSPLVIEIKTKENDGLVDYNKAVEVLAASEIHGYKNAFCITLCHPGVDPSVPMVIVDCGRLSVVESHDLSEALMRICENSLTQSQLWQWLATPGQALAADLPFREYN